MNTRPWRRGVAAVIAGTALAVGSVFGPTAVANADIVGELACEYGTAPGAGTISALLNQSVALSAQGYRPSSADLAQISTAADFRPNQVPMIEALQGMVANQQNTRMLAAAAAAGGSGPTSSITVNQVDPSNPFGTQGFDNDPFPTQNQVILGGGINLGGQNYTIGNGGENVIPVGC